MDELAEGEDPSTSSLKEAERWVSVYTELTHLESDLITEVNDRVSTMSPDLPVLQKDAERFRARLTFWREREAQLKDNE